MRVFRAVIFASLLMTLSAYSQNRDSVLLDQLNKGLKTNDDVFLQLYVEGRISHGDLLISSPRYRERFYGNRIRLIKKLRKQLRNKYALDYLVTRADTTFHESFPPLQEDTKDDFKVLRSDNPRVDEAFVLLGTNYRLFRCPSFDGKESYRLLTAGPDTVFERFDLFRSQAQRPVRLDSFTVSRPGVAGSFSLDTINGGNIFRIEDRSWGSEHKTTNLHMLTVRKGKFIRVFHCSVAELATGADTATHRVMRALAYKDLNGDGRLDITVTGSDDIVEPGSWQEGDFGGLKVISHVSTQETNYLWNAATLTFDPAPLK